ncbi:MAG: bacitracin transport system permease protein [Clostridiales bacterium]|nr:bacitracin transport system permease protein [Clostridiales bacterium]
MNNRFYPRLAKTNIQKNAKFYLPYLVTCTGSILMFYIMCFIKNHPGIKEMPGGGSLSSIMYFGSVVVAIFSFIFLFYTNSFLMKRRKKELGLYNILGMEKRHIAKMMFFEMLGIALISLVLGLLGGILFSKLVILILLKLLKFTTPIVFTISIKGLVETALLFGGIFLLTLLSNLARVHLSNPIDLLKGGNVGEREPKSKWLLALLGVVSLGGGYLIAILVESPISAISLFFVAVLLVIIGTYCLFTAGSIVFLKQLRKKKTYYYQTKHFISVSGMLYRMKQNAVGLSNICILSTMVLVMVSTTICLYLGVEEELVFRYPADFSIEKRYEPAEDGFQTDLREQVLQTLKDKKYSVSNVSEVTYIAMTVMQKGSTFYWGDMENGAYSKDQCALVILTAAEYNRLLNQTLSLKKDEIALYSTKDQPDKEINLFGDTYQVKQVLEREPFSSDFRAYYMKVHYLVVADNTVLYQLYEMQKKEYKNYTSKILYHLSFDVAGSEADKLEAFHSIPKIDAYVSSRQAVRQVFQSNYGGFLFLGIFLGILFLMATVLIIYYKQISEGYEDKERFEIMQKVGMSHLEVKKSIQSQVMTVFFLPLVVAAIHVAAAFPMITRLLVLFNLTNTTFFVYCTLGTLLCFTLIYGIVYLVTARVYYRIVE